MSDSLRDQLKQAGFKEKKPANKPKSGRSGSGPPNGSGPRAEQVRGSSKRHTRSTGKVAAASVAQQRQGEASTEQLAAIERRKASKARIRALIEANRITEYAGESVYRFTQGARIKQLFVTDAIRQQLIAGELLITRLNGSTHLVPPTIGEQILAINPEWAVVDPRALATAEGTADADDEYADYQVPDDLQW